MTSAFDDGRDGQVMGELVHLLRGAATPEEDAPSRRGDAPRMPPRALVDALRRLHERSDGRRSAGSAPDAEDAAGRYDRVRQLFQRRERALREEALLVDRILDQLRDGRDVRALPDDAVLQQTLRIACPAGGASGGRFAVANETGASARVTATIGAPRADGALVAGVALRVEPAALALPAGGSAAMVLAVELGAGAPPPRAVVDAAISLHAGERRMGRLWVSVVVTETLP